MKRVTLEFLAFCLMMFCTLLIAVMLGACSGGGGSSNSATTSTGQQKPTINNPDTIINSQDTNTTKPFIWDQSRWE